MSAKKAKAKSKSAKAKAKTTAAKASEAKAPKQKLPPVNELSFAMIANRVADEDRELFKEDAVEYMFSYYNIDFEMELIVVENDKKTVHLALPYYRPVLDK